MIPFIDFDIKLFLNPFGNKYYVIIFKNKLCIFVY